MKVKSMISWAGQLKDNPREVAQKLEQLLSGHDYMTVTLHSDGGYIPDVYDRQKLKKVQLGGTGNLLIEDSYGVYPISEEAHITINAMQATIRQKSSSGNNLIWVFRRQLR